MTVNLATTGGQNTVGGGSDTLVAVENVVGSAFNDVLTGSTIENTIDGAGGDDILVGAAGNDVLTGGAGLDTADYSAAALGVAVDLHRTGAQQTGPLGADALSAIENLTGGAGRDVLTGDGGPNVIIGGAGFDTVVGGAGDDILDGGTGVDTVSYADDSAGVQVSLTTGIGTSPTGMDVLSGFEGVLGGRGRRPPDRRRRGNTLTGGAGTDRLNGMGGDDTLVGGDGRDRLEGLAGNDVLRGGPGRDVVDYSAFFSVNLLVGVHVDLRRGRATGDGADILAGLEDVLGSGFDDTIAGDREANALIGRGGRDRLSGGGGRDMLAGGAGRDLLSGDGGDDVLIARDGTRDRLRGGPGEDRARIDRRLDRCFQVEHH